MAPRHAERRRALEGSNAVISMLLAGQFPLGSVPRPEIERSRGWRAGLVRRPGALA